VDWDVQIKQDRHTKSYKISASKSYRARAEAIDKFINEFHLPGRPYEYISGDRKGVLEVSVRCDVDSRAQNRVDYKSPQKLPS
jgi:hypothetical protein